MINISLVEMQEEKSQRNLVDPAQEEESRNLTVRT